MKLLTLICSLFLLLIICEGREKARYDFYRVYQIFIKNDEHFKFFQLISEYPDGYQFLENSPNLVGTNALLIVPPHKFGEWSEWMEKLKLRTHLVSNNFQRLIDNEEAKLARRSTLDWNNFWTLDEIYGWMDNLVANNPNDMRIMKLGTSYEGRDIRVLNINVGNTPNKPAIFFEGTIHSGEWLSFTSITFIINELITKNNPIVNDFNWYFVPVLNVDGFVYAWEYSRLWRKTRRPSRNNVFCVGADPNRNSNIHWNETNVSTNPCSHNYPGDYAFSEIEVLDLSIFVRNITNLKIYFSFHQFGQLTMIAPGFTFVKSDNFQLHYDIGTLANNAIFEKTGARYQVGQVSEFFGLTSGSSTDYVAEYFKPALTYCWELRPNRGGVIDENEIISSDQIQPTGEDMYAATTTIINEAISRGII